LAKSDHGRPAQNGVLTGVLIYDVAAAGLLAHAGLSLGMQGVLLWPAVVLHVLLVAWCCVVLLGGSRRPV
jgi:hypothetical protein